MHTLGTFHDPSPRTICTPPDAAKGDSVRLRVPVGVVRGALVALVVLAMITGTLVPTHNGTLGQGAPSARTLQSLYVSTPPELDGLPDDPVWSEAVEVEVALKGGAFRGDVRMRSVYTDDDIYLYAEWEDSTMSMSRGINAWTYNPVPENTVRSSRTTTAPVIDGDGTDVVWRTALPLKVNLEFGTNPGEVVIRSVHTTTDVYFQIQWNDPTFSIPSASWVYDGGAGTWDHNDGLEDMVNLMWDIKTTGFDNIGCQAKCHIGKDWSYLDKQGDVADLWHIMASRSMAASSAEQLSPPTVVDYEATSGAFRLLGYGDDTKVVYDPNLGQFPTGGRMGDEGTAPFANNTNASGEAPMYIEDDPDDWLDAMVLTSDEVDAGETVVADPSDPAYDQADVEAAWTLYDALGASVPEFILSKPTGSRGDLTSGATWRDGVWTVETSRALVTGNADDAQFDDLTKSYPFGISTMNNTAGKGHNYITRPLHLDFLPFFSAGGEGYEDRITFLWEITPLESFDAAGCYIKCHPEFGRAGAFFESEGEKADMWHMKAARSLPFLEATQSGDVEVDEEHQATSGTFSFHGYVDDRMLGYDEAPHRGEGGWQGDEGAPSFVNNRNPDGTKPLYMESAPEDFIDAMVLTQTEIDAGEALDVATAQASELSEAADLYGSFGAVIPESIVRQPEGSRGDIEQAAVWEDGVWHTEIRRSLVTGNDDDVQFDDLQKTYRFSIAVMDDTNGSRHSTPGTETFLLSLYVPPQSYNITVGPILGRDGEPVRDAKVVLWRNATASLNGTTGSNGTFTITVPPEWADSTVEATVTKDGYEDLTFAAAIDDVGGFFPIAGTYPDFVREGEGGDDTPGLGAFAGLLALMVASTALAMHRRRVTWIRRNG